jgi:hypothetical protein
MNRVLWMNAADGALAWARPAKNRRKGRLPPMTPITASQPQDRGRTARMAAGRTVTASSPVSRIAAMAFLSVV